MASDDAAKPIDGAEEKVVNPGSGSLDQAWESAISAWINDHVRNSPIAGQTEAWNHLNAALPHLKTYLEREMKG